MVDYDPEKQDRRCRADRGRLFFASKRKNTIRRRADPLWQRPRAERQRGIFMVFEDFPLSEGVRRAVAEIGYTEPTPIQARSIPLILAGRDLIGRSNTGTGKTAAFSLPAIDRIDSEAEGVQVLVLCPTRELAMQAAAEVEKFSRYTPWVNAHVR